MSKIESGANTQSYVQTSQKYAASKWEQRSTTETKKHEEKTAEYSGAVNHNKTGVYNKNGIKVDLDKINETKANMKNNAGAFKAMAEAAQKNKTHGIGSKDADYWSDWVHKQLGKQYTVDEAKSLVADDGYWGVEQTSQRIVDMAKSLSGGNIENYDKLMNAIKKGFGAAEEAWGGKMPDITSKTYDAVMEKMSAWKEEMSK